MRRAIGLLVFSLGLVSICIVGFAGGFKSSNPDLWWADSVVIIWLFMTGLAIVHMALGKVNLTISAVATGLFFGMIFLALGINIAYGPTPAEYHPLMENIALWCLVVGWPFTVIFDLIYQLYKRMPDNSEEE